MAPHSSQPHRTAAAPAVLSLLLATTIAALAPSATTAAAATPCGKAVVADWWDNGRIDRLYDLACYEEAKDSIPHEIRVYSDAEEVIERALQAAAGGRLAKGGVDPTPDIDSTDLKRPAVSKKPNDAGREPEVTPDIDTTAPSSLPIPLLVLGVMSLALLAAGALGYLSRRRQSHQLDDSRDTDRPVGGD